MSKSYEIDFAKQLQDHLKQGIDMTCKEAVKIINTHANNLKDKIAQDSPIDNKGDNPGEYKNNWHLKRASARGFEINEAVIYQGKPTYHLTHLLEYGHGYIDKNGERHQPKAGKEGKRPHIYGNESKEIVQLIEDLNAKLGGG